MLCMKLIELQTAFSAIRAARWCKSDAYIMLLWKECDKELEWLRYSLCVHTVLSFHSEKKNKNTDKLTAWSGPLWSHSVSNASVLFWLFTQFFFFFFFLFFWGASQSPVMINNLFAMSHLGTALSSQMHTHVLCSVTWLWLGYGPLFTCWWKGSS